MADNVIANSGSGGATFRTLAEVTTGLEYPASVLAWPTTISPGANVLQLVDPTHGLPTAVLSLPALAAGSASIGTVILGAGSASVGTVIIGAGAAAIGSVTVTGTVAATQSGSWTVNAGTNLNTSALALEAGGNLAGINGKLPSLGQALAAASVPVVLTAAQLATLTPLATVTANAGSGTFAVSAASLPLPAGAATSAKQPALGTAGTASADVITVQGVASMTAIKVDGSGVTQPVSGTITANAGTGTMAVSAASLPLPSGASTAAKQAALGTAGSASADVLSVQGIASMTALKVDGSGVTQPVSGNVGLAPQTSGGLSVSRLIAAAGSNQDQTQVKASAGQIFGWDIYCTQAAARYVKIYNKAAPTSADTPVLTLLIPGNAAGAGNNKEIANGISFGTAIGFRITTGYADNDAGTATAGDVIVNVEYK
jgi:hypothetical protein